MFQTENLDEASLQLEVQTKRVVIQGYPGAFHEIATRRCFPDAQVEIIPALTFEKMVRMAEEDTTIDYAIMAIENTLAGSLMNNYRLLDNSKLTIVQEVFLRIKQNLMVLPGVKLEEIEEVQSHPIAIAQCLDFFSQYPHIRLVETADTALSAKNIRDNNLKNIGAIASSLAAEMYGLEILADSIETSKKNHTRFLLLERAAEVKENEAADKVSLSFSVDHQVGSLYKVLAVLAAYNVNLTKIQSAPIIGKPWEYRFYLDFVEEGKVSHLQAIEAITPLVHDLNVLGSYVQGERFDE